MADLGAIAIMSNLASRVIKVPFYLTSDVSLLIALSGKGRLSGVIKNGAVIYADARVFLMYQPTMAVVEEIRSGAAGEFAFTELIVGLADYAIIFKHKDTSVNSVIFANLNPVV